MDTKDVSVTAAAVAVTALVAAKAAIVVKEMVQEHRASKAQNPK